MIELYEYGKEYLVQLTGTPSEIKEDRYTIENFIQNKRVCKEYDGYLVPNLDEVSLYFNIGIEEDYEDIGDTLKLSPYEYQKEAIRFCLKRKTALLVLPCGSGKTVLGIGTYAELIKRGLIKGPGMVIVKASLKTQWASEVIKFSHFKPVVIQTKAAIGTNIKNKIKSRKRKLTRKDLTAKEKKALQKEIKELEKDINSVFLEQFEGADLFILNYEALCDDDIRQALHKKKIKYLISDESHYIKNHKAERSKALCEFSYVPYKIESTATPVQKNYEDIYGLFKLLRPEFWPTHSKFAQKHIRYYAPGRIGEFLNIDHLKTQISPYVFIKTKEEISSQLPELLVFQRHCDMSFEAQEMHERIMTELLNLREDEKNIRATCKTEREAEQNPKLLAIEAKVMALQTFAQEIADAPELLALSDSEYAKDYKLPKSTPNPKLELLASLVEEIIESGEKVAIFSKFERMQGIMQARLQKIDKRMKFAYVNGAIKDEKRFDEVYNKFRDQDDYKVLFITNAGSEGLNLSRCKYLIEYDLAESYAIQTQRHGRIERADSIHDTAIVYQLICNKSWDEIALKIIEKKEGYDFELFKRS